MKTVKNRFFALFVLIGMGVLLWFPRAASTGISRGLSLCGSVLIPSLFPFLVMGNILAASGTSGGGRLTRRLFGVDGRCGSALLLAFVGGYPAGANALAKLREQNAVSEQDARRLLTFCVCAGPGFTVNAVGVGLLGDARFGWALFAADILSALLIGIATTPQKCRRAVPAPPSQPHPTNQKDVFVTAVTAACESTLFMCGFVLLFSTILSLCDAGGLTQLLGRFGNTVAILLPCFLEVSNGCTAAADGIVGAPFFLGFAIGFGGLSVCCQVAAAVGKTRLLTPSFWTVRLCHGILCALLSSWAYRLIPHPLAVFGGTATPVTQVFSGSAVLSAFLLLFCGLWMLTVPTLPLRRARP